MSWTLINAVWLLAPVFLAWGWVQYVGLSAPILSLVLGIADRMLAHPTIGPNSFTPAPRLSPMVVWIPIVGMLVGLPGKPRLILPIVWASVGTVLFWYGTTLP